MEVKYTMALTEAKVEAAKMSREKRKHIYILVNSEGDCGLSESPVEGETQLCYSNGSQIALDAEMENTTTTPKERKTPGKKSSATKTDKVESTVTKQTTKVMATTAKSKKSPAKKSDKAPVQSAQGANDIGKATTLFLNKDQWKKFWDKMDKNGVNFREWIKGAALSYIK